MDTPARADGVRRYRILDGGAVLFLLAGFVASSAVWDHAKTQDPDPDMGPMLLVGGVLWIAAAVLFGSSAIVKTLLDARPYAEVPPPADRPRSQ